MATTDQPVPSARPLRQAVTLVLLGCLLGLVTDVVLPGGALGRRDSVLRDVELVVPVHLHRPAELAARLRAGEEILLLDCRSAEEFRAGHVGGALHVPDGRVGGRFDELAERVADREVVVILPTGEAEAARRLAQEVVTDLGAASAGTVEGGWEALRREELPLATGGEDR